MRYRIAKGPDPITLIRRVEHNKSEVTIEVVLGARRAFSPSHIDHVTEPVYLAAVSVLVDRDPILPTQFVTPTLVMHTAATLENEGKRYATSGWLDYEEIIGSLESMGFINSKHPQNEKR